MTLKRGFKSKAERMALDIREKVGVPTTGRFCPVAACKHFEISLLKMTELPCDVSLLSGNDNDLFSAMSVPCGLSMAIVHNDTHHVWRQNSNIAHELAHCFLGHESCSIINDNGTRNYDSEKEAEASYLGGALLLPKETALYILKNGLQSQAKSLYGVSTPMLTYRLRVSGAQTIHNRMKAKYG